MIGRVATFSFTSSLLSSSMQVQARMAEVELQTASGLVSDTYSGYAAGTTSRVLTLQDALARSQSLTSSLTTASGRVDAMYDAVNSMTDLATSLRSLLSSASAASDADVNGTAEGILEDLQNLLNLQYEGRYLFAGSRTSAAPVDTSALTTPTVPSSADTSYYSGDSYTAAVRLSDEQTLTYGVTANDSAFEALIRAANIAATMTTDPLDEDALAEAYDLATEAIDGMAVILGGLSNDASRIDTALAREEAMQTMVSNTLGDLTQVDVAEASVILAQYETQLQASYSAISSVVNLSLADYL